MKVNMDAVGGGIVATLILAIIAWGVLVTTKVNRVARAHDNLVKIMTPVINQIMQAEAQAQRAKQGSVVPAPVQEKKPGAK